MIMFLDAATQTRQPLTAEYDAALVVLSFLTASIASSAALLIAWRARFGAPGRRSGRVWLALGALTLGLGVWAMHFVAMLAMALPVATTYDVPITVASIVPAVVAGAVCLVGATRGTPAWLVGGGIVMGLGIGVMHYVGMAAMRVAADMLYAPWPFALSLVVAPLLAIASLYSVRWAIARSMANPAPAVLLSGALMGLAVSAMHYTGMWAVRFLPRADGSAPAAAPGMEAVHLGVLVAAAILGIVALAVAAVVTDFRFKQLRAAAASEADKFAVLLEAVPDGVIGASADGAIRFSNSRVEDLFGYRKEALLGQPLELLMPERIGATGIHASAELIGDTAHAAIDNRARLRGRHADGSRFPVEVSTNRITTPEGPLTICAIRDVTEQESAREALRNANEKLTAGMAKLESRSRELHFLTDMGEMLQECEEEREAYEIIGHSIDKLLPGMPGTAYMLSRSRNVLQSIASWGDGNDAMTPVFDPTDCWALRRGRMYVAAGEHRPIACRHVGDLQAGYVCIPMLAHGEVLGVLHVVTRAEGEDGLESLVERRRILLIAIAEKISTAVASLRLREELRNQSIRDPLTGLLNRRFMEEALERELVRASRTATPLSVVAIDLDHFKRFNDVFGHEGGDLVLREVGALLSKAARGDNLACRLGGEELLLILPDTPVDAAVDLTERLRRKIERLSIVAHGQQLGKVTASFGVAEYPGHGDGQADVLRAADQALYRAKAGGRNRIEIAERIEDTLSVSIPAIPEPSETADGAQDD